MKSILFIALIIGISPYTANEKQIWDFLVGEAGLTQAGAAGLMGNLQAESGMQSVIYENAYKNSIGLSDQEYVNRVNDGRYPESKFINDLVGFGLAQGLIL